MLLYFCILSNNSRTCHSLEEGFQKSLVLNRHPTPNTLQLNSKN